jgi:hypothetical protein
MGIFRRGEKIDIIAFDNGLKEVVIGKVTKDGNMLVDGLIGRHYTIATKPIILKDGKKRKIAYLVDSEKGCTVEVERDDSVLKLKTNPDLVGKIIDSRLIQQAFSIRVETRQIIASLIIGVILGWIVGALFF